MNEKTRNHPTLGNLCWDRSLERWETQIELAGNRVHLSLLAEVEYRNYAEPDALFAAGVDHLSWARIVEPRCRDHIADELIDCYNEVWANQGAGDDSDAPPRLVKERFVQMIELAGINLHPDGSACWYYDDNDLFAGHSIEVWASENRESSGASLAG